MTYNGCFPADYLAERVQLSRARAYGFHYKLGQASSPGDPLSQRFLSGLHSAGWRIIHVQRRNLFRQAISAMIAQERGVWHDTSPAAWKVRIDAKRLLAALKNAEIADLAHRAIMGKLPHLPVTYEDDLLRPECHQETAGRVFAFLDVPPAPVVAKYHRSTTSRLVDCVANYEEIVRAVSRTRYARYLEASGDE